MIKNIITNQNNDESNDLNLENHLLTLERKRKFDSINFDVLSQKEKLEILNLCHLFVENSIKRKDWRYLNLALKFNEKFKDNKLKKNIKIVLTKLKDSS